MAHLWITRTWTKLSTDFCSRSPLRSTLCSGLHSSVADLSQSGSNDGDICNKKNLLKFQPHSHKPYKELGFFYQHNTVAQAVCHNIRQMTLDALECIPIDKSSPFSMCDFGSSDGSNFMPLAYEIIRTLREKNGSSQPIQVFFEDQAYNDFKSLFLLTHGLLPGPESFMSQFPNVYTFASGTNFYHQCFPRNSLDIGYTSIAAHWLSKRPCAISNGVHISQSDKETERNMFKKQAEADLNTFLLNRANELKTGGILLFSCLCTNNSGLHSDMTVEGKPGFFDSMYNIILNMTDEGLIYEDEVLNTTFNSYYRTENDILEPFRENSQVRSAGLQLVKLEHVTTDDPLEIELRNSDIKGGKDAAREYARRLINEYRIWSNYTFLSALSDKRHEDEKEAILDEMFHRYEYLLQENPSQHAPRFYTHMDLLIVKK